MRFFFLYFLHLLTLPHLSLGLGGQYEPGSPWPVKGGSNAGQNRHLELSGGFPVYDGFWGDGLEDSGIHTPSWTAEYPLTSGTRPIQLSIAPGGVFLLAQDNTLTAGSIADGGYLWRITVPGVLYRSAMLAWGSAFVCDGAGFLTRVVPGNGTVQYSSDLLSGDCGSHGSPVATSSGLFVTGTPTGAVAAFASNGTVAWQCDLGTGPTFRGSLAVSADGSIFVTAGDGSIARVEQSDGSLRWRSQLDLGPIGSLVINALGMVIVASERYDLTPDQPYDTDNGPPRVMAIDPVDNSTLLWNVSVVGGRDGSDPSDLAVLGDGETVAMFSPSSNIIGTFNGSTGTELNATVIKHNLIAREIAMWDPSTVLVTAGAEGPVVWPAGTGSAFQDTIALTVATFPFFFSISIPAVTASGAVVAAKTQSAEMQVIRMVNPGVVFHLAKQAMNADEISGFTCVEVVRDGADTEAVVDVDVVVTGGTAAALVDYAVGSAQDWAMCKAKLPAISANLTSQTPCEPLGDPACAQTFTLRFGPGAVRGAVALSILRDVLPEPDETFHVSVRNLTVVAPGLAVGREDAPQRRLGHVASFPYNESTVTIGRPPNVTLAPPSATVTVPVPQASVWINFTVTEGFANATQGYACVFPGSARLSSTPVAVLVMGTPQGINGTNTTLTVPIGVACLVTNTVPAERVPLTPVLVRNLETGGDVDIIGAGFAGVSVAFTGSIASASPFLVEKARPLTLTVTGIGFGHTAGAQVKCTLSGTVESTAALTSVTSTTQVVCGFEKERIGTLAIGPAIVAVTENDVVIDPTAPPGPVVSVVYGVVQAPSPPVGVAVLSTQVALSWTAIPAHVTGGRAIVSITVLRNGSPIAQGLGPTTLVYTDTTATPETSQSYAILYLAAADDGTTTVPVVSPPSTTTVVVTPPPEPLLTGVQPSFIPTTGTTIVTLTGANLGPVTGPNATVILFNGAPAIVTQRRIGAHTHQLGAPTDDDAVTRSHGLVATRGIDGYDFQSAPTQQHSGDEKAYPNDDLPLSEATHRNARFHVSATVAPTVSGVGSGSHPGEILFLPGTADVPAGFQTLVVTVSVRDSLGRVSNGVALSFQAPPQVTAVVPGYAGIRDAGVGVSVYGTGLGRDLSDVAAGVTLGNGVACAVVGNGSDVTRAWVEAALGVVGSAGNGSTPVGNGSIAATTESLVGDIDAVVERVRLDAAGFVSNSTQLYCLPKLRTTTLASEGPVVVTTKSGGPPSMGSTSLPWWPRFSLVSPSVVSINPGVVTPGQTLTVRGNWLFGMGDVSVELQGGGGTCALVTLARDNSDGAVGPLAQRGSVLTCTVPVPTNTTLSLMPFMVRVTTALGGISAESDSAVALVDVSLILPPPTVASIAPVSGKLAGGAVITVTGTGFILRYGGTSTGSARLETLGALDNSEDDDDGIDALSVQQRAGGTTVSVLPQLRTIVAVTVAGRGCANYTVLSAERLECVTSFAPVDGLTGPVVVIASDGQSGTSPQTFTYIRDPTVDGDTPPVPAGPLNPAVFSVLPELHPHQGGILVTVTGRDLGRRVRIDVLFGGSGTAIASPLHSLNVSTLYSQDLGTFSAVFRSPPSPVSGAESVYADIAVTTLVSVDGKEVSALFGSRRTLRDSYPQEYANVGGGVGDDDRRQQRQQQQQHAIDADRLMTTVSGVVSVSASSSSSPSSPLLPPGIGVRSDTSPLPRLLVEKALYYTDTCLTPGVFGKDSVCSPCPEGALCPGGNRLWPTDGFWNPNEASGYVVKCEPPSVERCVEGNGGTCGDGYVGFACSECADGYVEQQGGRCVKCPSQGGVVALIVADVVLWLLVALTAWTVKDGENFQRAVQFVNTVQDVSMFSGLLSSDMPKWILAVYDVFKIVLGDYSILRTECLSSKPPYALSFVASLLHSLAILFVMYVGALAISAVRRILEPNKSRRRALRRFYTDRCGRIVTVWLQLAYITITATAFAALNCVPDAARGSGTFVESEPVQPCFSSDHGWVFALSVAIVLAITIAWPLLYTHKLRITPAEEMLRPRYRHRWGAHFVLLKPGHRRYFYLGSYASMLSVCVALEFFRTRPVARVLTAGLVILAHVSLLVFWKPHRERRDDWMLLSFELPMLMLVCIGAAAELGSLSGTPLKVLSVATLAILAGCVIANLADLAWHFAFKHFSKDAAKHGPQTTDTLDGEEWARVGSTEMGSPTSHGNRTRNGRSGNGGGDGDDDYSSESAEDTSNPYSFAHNKSETYAMAVSTRGAGSNSPYAAEGDANYYGSAGGGGSGGSNRNPNGYAIGYAGSDRPGSASYQNGGNSDAVSPRPPAAAEKGFVERVVEMVTGVFSSPEEDQVSERRGEPPTLTRSGYSVGSIAGDANADADASSV